ncbi:MAG: ABC transporter ATP-binding protein [Gammaproteobacteria bacterium]|nr:ABC transporter ATP-binding protein [Gammaproteobacteria bacterium]
MDSQRDEIDVGVIQRLGVAIGVVPRVLAFAWNARPITLLITSLFSVAIALIPAGIVWMTKLIVDGVVEAIDGGVHWYELVPFALTVLALWVIQSVFGSVVDQIKLVLSEPLGFLAQDRVAEKTARLDLAFFDSPKLQDLLHRGSGEFWRLGHITLASIQLPCAILGMCATFGLLATIHPLAVVVVLVTVSPRVFMEGRVANREFAYFEKFTRHERVINYVVSLLNSRSSAKEIRAYALDKPLLKRFRQHVDALSAVHRRNFEDHVKHGVLFDLLALGGVAGVWIYGIHQAATSQITLGDLALVMQVSQQAQGQLRGLISALGDIYSNSLFISRFFQFLRIEPSTIEGALTHTKEPTRQFKLDREISFRSVSFKYPGSTNLALRDVSFDIPVGKRVAIVGKNGAGKSTLVKLFCRLYDPTEGSVLVDGIDLRNFDLSDVRRNVGVTFQDFLKLDMTVAENINLEFAERTEDLHRIVRAGEATGVGEFVEKLDQGYRTALGQTIDEGTDLSGGQWQALAISRAYVNEPAVLVLDEPTSALDALAEGRLFERIASATEGKTVVFISHRFSTVRMADIIVVLDDGRVAEIGSHFDLMSEKGLYESMFSTQAGRYTADATPSSPA